MIGQHIIKDPFQNMAHVMEVAVNEFVQFPKNDLREQILRKQISHHLFAFIQHFGDIESLRIRGPHIESLLMLRKWAQFTNVCESIGNSPFSHLTDSEVNSLFFGEGVCVGTVVHYFSKFFKTHSLHESSPYPFLDSPSDDSVKFCRFNVDESSLDQTKRLRFLQAAFKVSSQFRTKGSLEFVPDGILRNNNLELVKRIPEISQMVAFDIEELLPQFKLLANQQKEERGYLLGIIYNGSVSHALSFYLRPPFHFLDPSYGIGIADNLENLALFLANYLTEKYEDYRSFALLEFAPHARQVAPHAQPRTTLENKKLDWKASETSFGIPCVIF